MMPVNTVPTRTPSNGLLKAVRICENSGMSAKGLTESFISCMPYISTAKPMKIEPMLFFLSLFPIMKKMIPINATMGEKRFWYKHCIKAGDMLK